MKRLIKFCAKQQLFLHPRQCRTEEQQLYHLQGIYKQSPVDDENVLDIKLTVFVHCIRISTPIL